MYSTYFLSQRDRNKPLQTMDMFSQLKASSYAAPPKNDSINLDELYSRQHSLKVAREETYDKVLQRIHNKIRTAARVTPDQQFLFYVVPEVLLGIPRYNVQHCVAHVMKKLQENGFYVGYTHPNLLFISWEHYVPTFERERVKKEFGVRIDEHGQVIPDPAPKHDPLDLHKSVAERNAAHDREEARKKKSEFADTADYEPTGIYGRDLMLRLGTKLG
jgi:hypothetical protein